MARTRRPVLTLQLHRRRERIRVGIPARETLEERARGMRPYVDRLLHDEELREHLQGAFESARSVLDELRGPGAMGVAGRLATDEGLQKQVREMVAEISEARARLQGKKDHTFRNLVLIASGAVAVFVLFRRHQDDYAAGNGR